MAYGDEVVCDHRIAAAATLQSTSFSEATLNAFLVYHLGLDEYYPLKFNLGL